MEDPGGASRKRLIAVMRRALADANARTRRFEAEAFERMRFPANMGWFKGDTEAVEVNYWVTREGEVVRLIADRDEPWPLRGQLQNPPPPPAKEAGPDGEKE